MRRGFWLFSRLVAAGAFALACTDFPVIPGGVCGNGVIDPATEDCDSFGLGNGTQCRPKGAERECHLDCAAHDGARTPCPAGWGCDSESVCRRPTGDFAATAQPADVGAWTLATGDFDHDGRGDVLSLEPLDSIGATRLRFYYFDEQGVVEDTRAFPKLVLSPVIKDISQDGLSDVAFSAGPIGVMLGRRDRTWIPETFSSYRVTGINLRVVMVSDQDVQGLTPIVSLLSSASGSTFATPDINSGKLTPRADFAGSIANLAGDPVSGNLLEDPIASPCLEPVLAELGSSHFTVVNTCVVEAGVVAWRPQFEQRTVELEPRASIDHAPLVVDLNNDGHLDVLVGAAGRAYVSYGDGKGLSDAIPYRLSLATGPNEPSPDIAMPLAAGDFTGDGAPDFVFPTHLLVSVAAPAGQLPSYLGGVANRLGAPWTVAKIADFNGNGKLDVVAASSAALNVDFFNGTGTSVFTGTTISTDSPVRFLAVGDFDGDSIGDLALIEQPPPNAAKSPVLVTFGAPFVPLGAPVVVGQVAEPQQMVAGQNVALAGLAITSSETSNGVSTGALTFLDGSPDRIPFAPYSLTEFSSSGSVIDSNAFAVAAGSFSGRGQGDVMALAFPNEQQTQLWLLPNIESSQGRPTLLPSELSSPLSPTTFSDLDFSADASSASADLDQDGRDEAIFAMPAGQKRDQCGVLTVGARGSSEIVARDPVLVPEACPDPVILPVDADGDGWVDLVLLTGAAAGSDRKLYVLWNDGAGGFAISAATQPALGTDSPQAFTALPASFGRPFGLAYVTKNGVRLVTISGARDFAAPITPTSLEQMSGVTGIVASDVNGDGVVDLVISSSGQLTVLRAGLELP